MGKLLHYVHCPYCVRVRMALGYLNVKFDSKVVPYNDEETPIQLTGKKMLPIFISVDGKSMNESLDIIFKHDTEDKLNRAFYESHAQELDQILSTFGSPIHSLCMPYWMWTPEFDDNSRKYFQTKKEVKRGPFSNLINDKEKYLKKIDALLDQHSNRLKPFYQNDQFSLCDIALASHLWGLYIFPEFQFPKNWHDYLQNVQSLSNFNYHQDFWND